MEERFEAEGIVWTGGGALRGAVLAVIAAVAAFISRFTLALLLPSLLVLAFVAYRLSRRKGTISASESGVRVDGKLLLARSDLRDGYVTRRHGCVAVALIATAGRRLDIDVGKAGAWGLVRALGLDIAQRPLRLRAESAGTPEVTLGDDGVVICTPVSGLLSWNVQFISYGEMKSVARARGDVGVDIVLRSGEVVPVFMESERLADAARLGIARMIDAFQGTQVPETRSAAIYRRSRHEELWRVLEQPSADPARRASAALALGKVMRGEERGRLIAATRAAVAPVVRSAVQMALAGPP